MIVFVLVLTIALIASAVSAYKSAQKPVKRTSKKGVQVPRGRVK